MKIKRIDHIEITTKDFEKCAEFYRKLKFKVIAQYDKYELYNGNFKIYVHLEGKDMSPSQYNIIPGSVNICFEISKNLEGAVEYLQSQGLEMEIGIVHRVGVRGPMKSAFFRDPDGNVIELSYYNPEDQLIKILSRNAAKT